MSDRSLPAPASRRFTRENGFVGNFIKNEPLSEDLPSVQRQHSSSEYGKHKSNGDGDDESPADDGSERVNSKSRKDTSLAATGSSGDGSDYGQDSGIVQLGSSEDSSEYSQDSDIVRTRSSRATSRRVPSGASVRETDLQLLCLPSKLSRAC